MFLEPFNQGCGAKLYKNVFERPIFINYANELIF